MNRRFPAFLLLTFLLAACGGGGGGSPGEPGGGGGGDGGSGDGGGNGDGDGDGDGDVSGSARILFPWTHSAATAPTVSVRGVAADSDGVASVTVNGTAATLVAAAQAAAPGVSAKPVLAEGEVEWVVELELATGENQLTVSVEDETGEVSEAAAAATISYVHVPTTFTLDPNAPRIVGLGSSLASTGFVQHLVEHDFATDEQRAHREQWGNPALSCFRHFENEYLWLELAAADTWELRGYDLTTEQESLILTLPVATLDPGPGYAPNPRVSRLVCGGTHASAYVLVNDADEDEQDHGGSGYARSRILELDLASPSVSLLAETDTGAADRWIGYDMALAEESIVVLRDGFAAPLMNVALQDGEVTELTPALPVSGLALAPALPSDRVYVATFAGIDEIDLAGPAKRNVSVVDPAHPLSFAQVRSLAIDPANDRVLVGDSDLEMVIGVDLAGGERSKLLSRDVGEGLPLIVPRHFALSSDGERAYVADDGGNVAARLFEVDLASGDRRVIGDIAPYITWVVTGIALDEQAERVFVSGHDVILEVDLQSEDVQAIADVDTTMLESVRGLLLDHANQRLLVGDFLSDGIFALALESHAVNVVSLPGQRGVGPGFGGIISLTRVGLTDEAYAAGQTSGLVTRVDLETGHRETLVTNCDLQDPPAFDNLEQVLYNEARHELIVSDDRLYAIDVATSACERLPRRVLPLEVQVTPENQMLAVSFRALMQLDRETGEVVIISR